MRLIAVLMILLGSMRLCAQGNADPYVKEADKYYEQMAYARAAELYRTATELGAVNEHVTKRLADCSMRLGDTVEAERWYAVVVKFLNREPKDLYNYAEALKSNGRYAEAEEWMDRYLALMNPEGGEQRSNLTGFAKKFTMDQQRFVVKPTAINTPYADMAAAWLGPGRVVFSSSRREPGIIKRWAAWNGQPFLDLFTANVTADGNLASPEPLAGSVNTRYHEGPATASASGDVLWFTRNNYYKGRAHRSQQGISRLGIYKARSNGNGFGEEEQFLYNNSEVSIAHPALSPSGRKLYFVSDMPGGFGGTDIYVCEDQGGQWSEPRNLGPAINTPYNEEFPYVAADGVLYFSSNGHPGLGGMDIFMANKGSDGEIAGALNLGAPINSPKDDMAFIIDAANKRGYFTSNRPGGAGDDDIYSFEMLAPLQERYFCSGMVIDDEYETAVPDAEVLLLDPEGKELEHTRTDAHGEFTFSVKRSSAYRLVAKMKGRYDGEQHVSTEGIERQLIITRDIHLVPDAGVLLRGVVRKEKDAGFIAGAKVTVVNLASFHNDVYIAGEGGDFSMRLQTNEDFEVLIEHPGYFSMSIPITTVGMKQGVFDLGTQKPIVLDPIVLDQPIALKYIRWSKGSTQLDPQARGELDQLADRLNVNPGVSIEIGVHSDARGDAAEQAQVTQLRADAIAAYLRTRGVLKDRVRARGFGSSRLLNHCAPGVQCSEEEHAVNRRNEYIVTSVQP
ncbi:MAG: PD40 domain-containing protein [Flavobacteriales bacterium]|nr:PD40 domain-containing protein [Flavobacteriales bacterium]MCC6939256.1 PD40 domain-containing protein [Flavobacteriales bacterium]